VNNSGETRCRLGQEKLRKISECYASCDKIFFVSRNLAERFFKRENLQKAEDIEISDVE